MVKQKHVDVMFIQEMHIDDKNNADWLRVWEGKVIIIISYKTSVSGGIGLLFSRKWIVQSLSRVDRMLFFRSIIKCVWWQYLVLAGDFN